MKRVLGCFGGGRRGWGGLRFVEILDTATILVYNSGMETKQILREMRGNLSHVEWAAELSVTVATVYAWESGRRTVGVVNLARLAKARPEMQEELLASLGMLPVEDE